MGKSNVISRDSVMGVLSTVNDPELKRDIVSLGFIEKLVVEGADVSFTVNLTTPACPMKDVIRDDCLKALREGFPGIGRIDIEFGARVRQAPGLQRDYPFKNVIAVGAGKGGVGKSTVAVNLAVSLANSGAVVGLLDADIYGPNIPGLLGVHEIPGKMGGSIKPVSKYGLELMSMGFMIPADQALVWRGPMIHSTLNQLLNQVEWGELDYLVVDLPPGTGDAQMSLAQQLPITGAVIVTTPQEVSVSDTRRGIDAFRKLKVPILGVIENMAGEIFGIGGGENVALKMGVPFLGRLFLSATIADAGEKGEPVFNNKDDPAALGMSRIAGAIAAGLSVLHAGGEEDGKQEGEQGSSNNKENNESQEGVQDDI